MAATSQPLLSHATDFKTHNAYLPRYRYAKVVLNNISSSSVPISLSSTNLMEWKLPANTVYNLSKSYIQYSYKVLGSQANAGNFVVTHEIGSDFCNYIYYGNGGGLGIVDLNQADRYLAVIRNIRTPTTEYMSNDVSALNYPCNMPASNNLVPFSRDGATTGTMNATTKNYTEPQYINIAPTPVTDVTVQRYWPLSSVKDTFLGMDRDVCFPIDMYLRFNTQFGSRLGYLTTTPNTPSLNVTALSAATVPTQYSNVYLFLAIEENRMIVDSLRESMLSGRMSYLIPYTFVYRFGQAATSTSASMTVTLTRQFGNKVKRLLYVPFNGAENSNLTYDHASVNSSKIQYIQTSLDSRPCTDYKLTCFNPQSSVNPNTIWTTVPAQNGDDYRESKKFLQGTAIPTYGEYQTNWFYADSWGLQAELDKANTSVSDDNIEDGLSLTDSDHVYSITVDTPYNGVAGSNTFTNSIAHYIFALFTRLLIVTPSGIEFGQNK